jgi:hypothetical protein
MHESSAPSLAKIDRELTGIYQWLNEQSLFNQRFERTALSINKQLLQLEELLVRFNEWQNLGPRFLHFYEWNKFIRSQDDKARHLLTKMAILQPKDWLTFFRNWYIQNSILHASDPYNVQVEKEVHELLLLEKEMQNTGIDKYHYTKSENKQMVLKKLKEKDRGLHRDLIRKSHPLDLPFDHLLSEHFDLISYIFPVHFISFEDLKGMKDRSKLKYDLLIVDAEDWHKNNLDINLDFLALGEKVIFADTAGQPFTLYCQEKKCAPAIFDLKGYHLQNIIDLKDMLPTERLYAARHLAHLLEDLHGDITIYHLGTNILYSCFSDPLNIVFEKLMESRGLKKIRVLEKKIHTLVENILEVNAEHKIMTQDLMINSAKQDMLPWQWQVKAKMERAGMDIINFNTHDLLEDSLPAMLQFLADNFPEKNKA